jgi:metaxin
MAATAAEPRSGLFTAPAPIRSLFKAFPLHVSPADALPQRSPDASRPRLHVFSRDAADARAGRPSYNPSCLKWQTLLRIAAVDVDIVPSNNHASPSGSLPFLIPAGKTAQTVPLTGTKLLQYARENAGDKLRENEPAQLEAYQALLAQKIRPAWVRPPLTTTKKSFMIPPGPN